MRVAEPFVQTGLLGEAVDLAPAAVLVADEHGQYVAVNRFACDMLGYTRAELLSRRVHDISAEAEVEAHYDQFLKDRVAGGISKVRRKDGTTFDFRFRAGETTIAGLTYYVSVGFPEA